MTRSWLLIAALLLLPIAVYWPTVSHEYGFRDDYAHLREVREVPGWLPRLTASDGRPVYGHLLEVSVRPLHKVADLASLRLLCTMLLSVVGLLLWARLRRAGWSSLEAATIGALATLLPGAQVLASWAIAWPIALALVEAVAGFTLVDSGLARKGWQCALLIVAGAALYFVAGLTYQTSALFAVVPLAAGLLMRNTAMRDDTYWVAQHIGVLFVSLVSGWLLMNLMFNNGVVSAADRMHFESDPFGKLLWFVRNPLPNSLALFALRDTFATQIAFFLMLAAVAVVIGLGFFYGARDASQRRRWLFVALALPFVAHSVSLAANSEAIGYRTLIPLSGLFLVLAMFGLRTILARLHLRYAAQAGIYGVVLIATASQAQHNAFSLFAEPQGREWQIVKDAAELLQLDADTEVFFVRPVLGDRSTDRVYADEFGSLTSDAEWAVEEMFKTAMRERFPDGLPQGLRYTLATGIGLPAMPFDLIIDLRVLRQEGERMPAPTTALRD